ncbi:transporter substrate-binding domain-containing protein [Acidisoma cellulosilytica]|uniref:Transporter substrate-binding domain-containing protein n=1 Tax=Acidisoma cellulosilyticum TaxID=2802395 RepID=A0A963Z6W0_9PROT|nr:transporter substrate-binding domain-containing protein [Acidisoma cellulosilyticum]MCB8883629.1 transporter substrate-binding domain-containing protein [Acidisoma cellulosilyticum]
MFRTFKIGLLLSTTGSYGPMAHASLNGGLLAVDTLNARPDRKFNLVPVTSDPGGEPSHYARHASALLDQGIRHVVGCYTSLSRKEVVPVFEKRDALLWYPTHYEGFEASPNVVYVGGGPNQHTLPLIDWALRNVGRAAYCVGSNYVWAWETNRVLREGLIPAGGRIVGDRYIAVEDLDLDHVVQDILRVRPDFVFCTLIGASAARFMDLLRAACLSRGIDQARDMPLLTCNLTETTMLAVSPEARDGHVSSSVYFSSVDTPESHAFVSAFTRRFGAMPSADAESSFVAVHLLAQALEAVGTDDIDAVRAVANTLRVQAPQGEVKLEADTMHAWLTPRIGISRRDGGFDIIEEYEAPVRPDPYLVASTPRLAPVNLRLVS